VELALFHQNGVMKTVLMVAEKPSLAQSLAKILARGGQINSRKGSNGACSVHEFVARFPPIGESARFKFTSVCGHVMSLDFIGKYNNWDKVDPVCLNMDCIFVLWAWLCVAAEAAPRALLYTPCVI
jgi:DNA topoisomerase IA